MSDLIKRLGPTCAVLGVVVWCCWPYIRSSTSPLNAAPDAKLPRVARSVLSPEIRESSRRDPFQTAPDEAETSSFVPFAAMGRLLNKLREDRQWLGQRQTADSTALLAEHAVPEPSALSKRLTLNATYLHPTERLAVIDNRIYVEGDEVPVTGAADQPCTLKRVRRDRVVLQYRGETVVLAYPQPTPAPPQSETTAAPPTPLPHPTTELDPEMIRSELSRMLQG